MKSKFCVSLFCLAFFFVACAQSQQEGSNVEILSAQSFKAAIEKKGTQVLDVRTAVEYQGGHITGALQANWNDAKEFESRTQHLDKNSTVYVYCQAGGRSAAAQAYLMNKGYKVVNLEGGMSNWKMKGLPVEGNSNTTQMRVEDFDKVIASNQLVLVDIGATWCPPCRKMQPTIEEVKKVFSGKLYFLAVDGGVDMDVMKHIQFESLPTFIIYKNGKEVWRKTGIVEKEELIKQLQ
jgi:rhodanese-related sulfurtransferase